MNNDHEPQGDDGEDLPGDAAKRREASAGESAGSESAHGAGTSSDAGWRSTLSGLGVDTEDDKEWQEGREDKRSKPRHIEEGHAKPRSQRSQEAGDRSESEDERPGGSAPRATPRPSQGRHGMEEKTQWVGESEMSIEKLYELFDGAYMECDLDEDGDLRVVTDSGPRIFLSLHEPNKLIRYMAFYKFREEVVEYEKLLFVNALNDDIVFIRFSLNGADTLIADYYLPYARGTSPFQIINAAKLMGRVITSGIRQHDTNNLLE